MPVAETADPYAVSIETALDEMYATMDVIYGPATRASRPAIAAIETMKGEHLGGQTRSGEPLPENMYYIVNFEDEGGFAILGADVRSHPLICITEAGSMTLEDLLKSQEDSVTRSDGGSSGLTEEQRWCPYSQMEGYEYDPEDDPDPDGGEYLIEAYKEPDFLAGILMAGMNHETGEIYYYTQNSVVGEWKTLKKGPFLTTKWHQDAPFNWFSISGGKIWPAGCVPVAVAQVIAYNEKPSPSYFGVSSTWQELKNYDPNKYNITPKPADQLRVENDLGKIVSAVAQGVNAKYNFLGSGQTFAFPVKAKKYMKKQLGYGAKRRVGYKESVINSMIDAGKPIFIAAWDKRPLKGAHAWVIDGSLKIWRSVAIHETGHPWGDSRYTITETQCQYIHCNFGWGGKCDGYYITKCFDLRDGPEDVEATLDEDINDTANANYTWWYRIIQY